MKNQRPSHLRLLGRGQRRLLLVLLAGAALLLANSAYLALAAHAGGIGEDPHLLPLTYQAMLLMHVALGLLLVVPAVAFALWHLGRALKKRRPNTARTGLLVLGLGLFLAVSGLFILTEANSTTNRWAFIGHQAAAVLLPLAYFWHRWISRDRPAPRTLLRWSAAMAVLLVVLCAFHVGEVQGTKPPPTKTAGAYRTLTAGVPEVWRDPPVDDPFVPFVPAGDVDPDSPFFPSATTTSTGGFLPARIIHHDDLPDLEKFRAQTREQGFASSHYLGAQTCRRCHPDIVEQWAASAHRFASFNNPFYRAAVELTRENEGRKVSQWCGGCHDPAVMLAGNMTKEIDPLTPESQAGLTCLACHAMDAMHGITGNGNYNIQDEKDSAYLWFDSKGGVKRFVSDYLIKAKPTVHKRRMLKPFFRTSEYCSTCHKVHLDVPVNDYRWLRGQDEYDAWQNSGFGQNNPMTWYEPPAVKSCQDCHMPMEEVRHGDLAADEEGRVRSHRFLSVNTALPQIRGDQESIERIKDFRKDSLRVDVFALKRPDGPKVLALDRSRPAVRPGEEIEVDVVVRNKGVGHTFPGGTNDSNQGWVDFRVYLDDELLCRSGALGPDRRVDPGAHFYQAVLVDSEGRRIDRRNAPDIYTKVYVNVIKPSTSDIVRYRFRVPDGASGEMRIEADVMWRKFNRTYVEFVYEGKEVPEIPVTRVAGDAATLRVDPGGAGETVAREEDWKRFNDYGIGLFLDDDTAGAVKAFRTVTKLKPGLSDGWRNLGRVYLKEGNLEEAEAMLRKAHEVDPGEPRTAFFFGRLLEESGRLEEAVEAYRQTLEVYPDSRGAWASLGQTYYRMGRYRDCIRAFLEVLRIDPEHALAHHRRAQCYKALAVSAESPDLKAAFEFAHEEANKAYHKYKIDEHAQEVTRQYLLEHPYDNLMAQSIVVHELTTP